MKKKNVLHKGLLPILVFAALAFTFSACKKDNQNEQIPAAGLMSFNLVPGIPPIGVAVSGSIITNTPLEYTNYLGGYQALYIGERVVESFDWSTRQKLASTTQNFKDSTYYSLFVVGSKGHVSQVLTEDKFDELTDKDAPYVRYINAVPDSSQVTVTGNVGGNEIMNDRAKFKEVSSFVKASAGEFKVTVTNEGGVNKERTFALENGKVYTILLIGTPGSDDHEVEIKYIVNGTL